MIRVAIRSHALDNLVLDGILVAPGAIRATMTLLR